MCGITGVATTAANAARRAEALVLGLRHRGPGARRVVGNGRVALAATRLAVVGVDAAAGPHTSADGWVSATVNGEIWNHAELRAELRAHGETVPDGPDTAVVPALYARFGLDGLRRLRGMFALVLHDARTDTVVAARDRFGIKPLYVRTTHGQLEFASEAGVFGPPERIDRRALADYLALGFLPAPRTLDRTVEKLPAGTLRVYRAASSQDVSLGPPDVHADGGPASFLDALRAAVGRHLMADVPVGVFLSGGVDSAAIAALVAEHGAPVRTFSLSFPGAAGFDEGPAAARTAAWLGAEHVSVPMRPEDVPLLLPRLAAGFGEPFADSSALAVACLARRATEDVTVVLTGTGADELFVGYRRHAIGALPLGVRRAAGLVAGWLPQDRASPIGRCGLYAAKLGAAAAADPAAAYLSTLRVFSAQHAARLLGDDAPPPVLARIRESFRDTRSFAEGARRSDLGLYLPDDLLVKEDRATMAFSLENRVPFLDDQVAGVALATDADSHGPSVFGSRGKRRLRRALAPLLPPEVLHRRKQGFAVPLSGWLRGPCRAWVDERLLDADARVRAELDASVIDALVARHRTGDDRLAPGIYALLMLEESLRLGAASGP